MKTKSKKPAKTRKQPKRNKPAEVVESVAPVEAPMTTEAATDQVVTVAFIKKHWPNACEETLSKLLVTFPSGVPLSISRADFCRAMSDENLILIYATQLASELTNANNYVWCACSSCAPNQAEADRRFAAIVEIIRGAMDKGE